MWWGDEGKEAEEEKDRIRKEIGKRKHTRRRGKGIRASDGGGIGQYDQSKLSLLGNIIIKANILWLMHGMA